MIKAVLNIFIMFVYKLKYRNRVVVKSPSKSHILPKIRVERGGCISIDRAFMAEKNTSLESYTEGEIYIGSQVFMNSNVKVVAKKRITIGDNTVIGPNVCIYDHDHNWKSNDMQREFVEEEVRIGNNVWIGANCVILRGTVIEDDSVIAAGSVVKGFIESSSLFYQKKENIVKKK